MTTKKVYVACDGIEFYDEDKCRKYEDELDNLQVPNLIKALKVIASNKAIFSSYTCDRCPLMSICDSCFNERPPCYWHENNILKLGN
jgi:hypothetical protein|nr:MAG TPA: hypothetical protein [Caudoviricetes sp.]